MPEKKTALTTKTVDNKKTTMPDLKAEDVKTAKTALEKTEVKTAKPIVKAQVKPVAKTEAKPEVKPAAKIEAKPVAKIEVKPEIKPVAKAEAKPEVKPVTKPEVKPTVKSEAKTAKKVLFVASEVLPFAGTGGLGEVSGSLPKAIIDASKKGYDVRVVMPYYVSIISEEEKKYITYVGNINVNLSWRCQYCGVFTTVRDGVRIYFIDNEYYFKRNSLYGHYDDGERFAFFSKAALDILPLIDFFPDVLHCHDWQTALVPIYYKLYYMYQYKYEDIKTIFTIHNIEYQGKFGKECIEDLFGIPAREYLSISSDNCINLMKGAIDYSDVVSTVSPTYAKEIKSDYFAHGLAADLNRNAHKLTGILNGIDVIGYDSAKDKALFVNFDKDSLDNKVNNKLEIQKMFNLTVDAKIPMIAVISRLVAHKGVDLIKSISNELLARDVQFVILGTGNAEYEAFFTHLQNQYPAKVAAIIAYNKDLSRKIYAAADMFLMPSKSEPCGLSQMIASRYATVPLVRETGGLYDSIKDCHDGHFGNGYTFATYNSSDMLNCINRALGLYQFYPEIWRELMKRVINVDFSWNSSAIEYIKLYDNIISR